MIILPSDDDVRFRQRVKRNNLIKIGMCSIASIFFILLIVFIESGVDDRNARITKARIQQCASEAVSQGQLATMAMKECTIIWGESNEE